MSLRGYSLKETHALFPTCVMEFDLSENIETINVLLDIIKQSRSDNHEFISGGESSYHSGYNILDFKEVKPLKDIIELCINDYCIKTGLDKVSIANSWWNKLGTGGNVDYHRHYCSIISGAFYPLAGPGSGELIFNSPLSHYRMNEAYKTYNHFSAQHIVMPAKQYHMYLFPSWLEHGVKMNNAEDRLVVSFNADR